MTSLRPTRIGKGDDRIEASDEEERARQREARETLAQKAKQIGRDRRGSRRLAVR